MFFTRANHNEKERKETEAGRKTRLTFRWTYDDKGNKSLVQDEEIDRDKEIQSYLEETKIENIINRAAFDPSIVQKLGAQLSDAEPQDFTNMPSTLAEAQNLMIQAEQTWDKLPREIKQNSIMTLTSLSPISARSSGQMLWESFRNLWLTENR